MDTIANLKKGTNKKDLVLMMRHEPIDSFVPIEGQESEILVYNMQTGTTKQMRTVPVANGQSQTYWDTVPVYEKYFFLCNEGKVVFWGFVADYKKSFDPTIVEIGRAIQSRLAWKRKIPGQK